MTSNTSRFLRASGWLSLAASLFIAGAAANAATLPYGGVPWPVPGRIEAENFDEGSMGQEFNDISVENTGGSNYRQSPVDLEMCFDEGGGVNLSWIGAGEWVSYTVNVATGGSYTLRTRVASDGGDGAFRLEVNGVDRTGVVAVPHTGGWQQWQTLTTEGLPLPQGRHVLRIFMVRGGFNVNWIELLGPAAVWHSGQLKVTIHPEAARAAGAQWSTDGQRFHSSGAVVSDVPEGAQQVMFSAAPGYGLPPVTWATVQGGALTELSVWYSVEPPLVNWKLPPTNLVRRSYPKLANYHHGPQSLDRTLHIDAISERLAQWDLVIFSEYHAVATGVTAERLRRTNPRARLLFYAMYGSGPTWQSDAVPKEGPNDWFLRDAAGQVIRFWWGMKAMNPVAQDYAYPRYYSRILSELALASGRWDGIFLDVLGEYSPGDANNDGLYNGTDHALYQDANRVMAFSIKAKWPEALVLGNGGLPWTAQCAFYTAVDGGMHENALGTEFLPYSSAAADWATLWQGYRTAMQANRERPFYYIVAGDVQHNRTQAEAAALETLTADDLRRMRLGLGTTLLDDGYFSFDRGDGSHGELWWFDEYDADLGEAIAPWQKDVYAQGVYHRYFENGMVAVNPTSDARTIELGAELLDVSTRRSAPVITLPAADARILLGRAPLRELQRTIAFHGLPSGTVIAAPGTVRLEVRATSVHPGMKVDLYHGEPRIKTYNAEPFVFDWVIGTNDIGIHYWRAVVSDSSGGYLSTSFHPITVAAAPVQSDSARGLRRRIFRNIAGSSVANLRGASTYPASPDDEDIVPAFESIPDAENYGQALTGFIIPPVTGPYVFYLASDDQSQLWLSTNEEPAKKRLIVQENEWNFWRNWTGQTHGQYARTGRKSAVINLEAGKWYYVEALHKEASGGDRLSVTWQLPGADAPINGSLPIGPEYLAHTFAGTPLPPPPPTLGIATYAGIQIHGVAGSTYRIEFKTNALDDYWGFLDRITLSERRALLMDTNAPISGSRIYRAVLEP